MGCGTQRTYCNLEWPGKALLERPDKESQLTHLSSSTQQSLFPAQAGVQSGCPGQLAASRDLGIQASSLL